MPVVKAIERDRHDEQDPHEPVEFALERATGAARVRRADPRYARIPSPAPMATTMPSPRPPTTLVPE